MEARDYQARCCEAILSAVDAGHKAILCDLFTGAGKTFLFALLARMEWNCKFLVLAHQRELVWQAADMADKVLGATAEVEMGELWAQDYGNSMTVACTATLQRGRYRRFLGVDFIIVDEAHRQMSPPFLAMLQEFQAAGGVVIGFTATPFRMDRKKLMDFYTSHCFSMGFQAGIDEGWCVPPRAKIVRCKHLDLRHVAVSGGDYSAADLDLILGCSKPLHEQSLSAATPTSSQRTNATLCSAASARGRWSYCATARSPSWASTPRLRRRSSCSARPAPGASLSRSGDAPCGRCPALWTGLPVPLSGSKRSQAPPRVTSG